MIIRKYYMKLKKNIPHKFIKVFNEIDMYEVTT
jgi:hypothetical protein